MKTREEVLLYAFGGIEDKFVAEAAAARGKRRAAVRRWMKWGLAACIALILVVSVPALLQPGGSSSSSSSVPVTSGELQSMICVNGTVYGISAEEPYDSYRSDFVYLGKIASAVSSDEYPEEEMQSNDGELVGAAVYQYEEELVVCIDGQYWVYEPMVAEGETGDE